MPYATVTALPLMLIALVGAAPATQPMVSPPNVGDTAPDFSLNTLGGKTIKLAELIRAGPVVVLELRGWVGYQCPLCNRQVGDFLGNAETLRKAGAQVVLVYPGPAGELQKHAQDFIAGKSLPDGFAFVLDPELKFVNDYGLRWEAPKETAYPSTFVIDKAGIIRFAKVSHSHGDRATAKQVVDALSQLR